MDISYLMQETDTTTSVTWSSSNPSVASVNSTGLLTSFSAGATVITAKLNDDTGSFSVTVSNPLTTSLTLAPSVSSLYAGATKQYTATASYANNTTANITSSVQWFVTPSSVATISSTGLLSAVAPGNFIVSAVTASASTSALGTVVNAPLSSLAVTPGSPTVLSGSTQQFTATGTYNDGSTHTVSSSVSWTSSNPSLLTIDANGLASAPSSTSSGTVTITATLGSTTASATVQVSSGVTLTNLYVEPTSSSIANSTAEQHTAFAIYSDGSRKDVTSQVTWSVAASSSAQAHARVVGAQSVTPKANSSAVAVITPAGVDWAMAPGIASVQASLGTAQSQSVVIVTSATLVSLTTNSTESYFPIGSMQPVQLTGTFSDGTTQDLTLSATWQSSNPAVATIGATNGIAVGVAAGTASFTASFGGLTASQTLKVLPPDLVSLTVQVPDAAVVVGYTQQLGVLGTYSDGSVHDLTSLTTWSSADSSIISVSSTGVSDALQPGTTQITATVGKTSAIATLLSSVIPLRSVTIIPSSAKLALGTTFALTAAATFGNGLTVDVSAPAIWTSSDPTVITVDATGVVKAGKLGRATITASYLGVSQTSGPIQVTDATLTRMTIRSNITQVAVGTGAHFTAVGAFTDGSIQDLTTQVVWSTNNPAIATTDPTGRALGVSSGSVDVIATLFGQQVFAPLKVTNATLLSVALVPGNTELPVNTVHQYNMVGSFSDGTTQPLEHGVVWLSPTPSICSNHLQGHIVGTGPGMGAITAQRGYFSATTPVNVTSATLTSVSMTPATNTLYQYDVQQLNVIGTFSDGFTEDLTLNDILTSDNTAVAVPLDVTGLTFASGIGTAHFTAAVGNLSASSTFNVVSGLINSLVVTPAQPTVMTGTTQQLSALATNVDGSTADVAGSVDWTSSNPSVLSVDNNGLTTAYPVTVATTVTLTGQYSNKTVTFQVTVEPAGYVPPAATLSSITVTPSGRSLVAGSTQQFTATGTYSDSSTQDISSQVTWSSANTAVASISSSGLVSALAAGATTIQALSGSNSGSASLTVTAAPATSAPTLNGIVILPTSSHLARGTTVQLTVQGTYSDGSTANLSSTATWTSANSSIATVSSTGLATGIAAGITTVEAQIGSFSSTTTLNVSAATLTSVSISPSGASLAAGVPQQFTLSGTFSDGTQQNLGSAATWSSSAPATATVSATGLATGVAPGTVQFTASYNGQAASSTPVQVTAATLVSIAVSPSSPSFAKRSTEQFHVIGIYSDGTTHDLTASAVFSSSNPSAVSINTSGVASGLNVGSVQITASFGNQTATTQTVTVTPASLVSIAITPARPSFANGATEQFTATGTYSDGTTQDLSTQAVWSSSNAAVLTMDQSGLASSCGIGSVQVSANVNGITATTNTVEVTSATVTSLTISPTTAQIAKGTTQQFTVTGTFTDGTTQNLSTQATWTSSNSSAASVDGNGLATGIGVGSSQITASFGTHTASTSSFQVTGATLVSVALSPAHPSVAAGTSTQISVIGTFSDGTTQDLSSSASFSSSNSTVATVTANGLLTGTAPGTSTLTVTVNGATSTSTVSVSNATLTSIAITPASPSPLADGTTEQFTAIGTFSDGSTQNLSSAVSWTSSAPGVFSVDTHGLVTGTGVGSASLSAAYQGQSASTPTFQVTPATLASISVSPSSASLAQGQTQQLTATGTYTDSSTQNVSSQVTWTSQNTGVATVNASGLVTAAAAGASSITAQLGSTTSSPSTITVSTGASPSAPTLTSLSVTPTSSHLAAGTTVQLMVTGTYSDGSTQNLSSTATWTSQSTSIATVSNTGLVTAVAPGMANITAQVGSISGSSVINVSSATLVSVAISPSGATFAAGFTQQFTLTGTYSDGSTQNVSASASWTSSAPAVASISATGLATGNAAGAVSFTASYNGQTATTPTVQVTAATLVSISITPLNPSFAKGTTQQFQVIGTYSDGSTQNLTNSSTFSSSNTSVVSLSSAGLATGLAAGSVQVTATVAGQTAPTQSVTVVPATLVSIAITPSSPSLPDGTTQQFTAVGTFSDGSTQDLSTQVVWSSSNAAVLTINQSGLASSAATGTAQITASFNGVSSSSGTVQITPATLSSLAISPTTAQIAKGTTQQFTATGTYTDGSTRDLSSQVTWTSSNGTVASINASGLATGTAVGSAQITAAFGSQTASTSSFQVTPATLVSIAFTPANPSLAAGTSTQISVIGTFSDGTTQDLTSSAAFSSSSTSVATISSTGMLAGVAPGTSTITVTVSGMTNTLTVNVSNATLSSIAITPANPSPLANGTTEQFTATGTFSDGTTQNLTSTVTWTSSASGVFTIDTYGLVTATGVGNASLTAAYQGQSSTLSSIQVTAANLASISVSPTSASLVSGTTQQFTATGTYTDNSTQTLTTQVAWTSSNTSTATINSSGLATSAAAGSTTIQAQLNGLTGSASLTVSAAPVVLRSITVAPASPSIQVSAAQQFTATGTYSDGSTQNLTSQVTWSSTNTSTATINSTGLATGVANGTTSIQAQLSGVSGSANLTVSNAPVTLTTISITPSQASISSGNTQQFTATGTYSDGSTQNLTSQVAWQSSVTATATINSSGLATGVSAGNTQIWATLGSQSAAVAFTVSPATLASLAVTPQSVTLADGTNQQYKAVGTFSDGSTQDLTSSVTWASSSSSVASINAAGLAATHGTGSTTITAQSGLVSNSASMTVTAATAVSIQISPSSLSLSSGGVQQLLATATFTDGSSQNVTSSVHYMTSNPSVVTVDANGNLTAVGTGSATVTATLNAVSTVLNVTITPATLTSIAITPTNLSLAAGMTQQFTATGTFSDGSTQDLTSSVTWASSDPHVATISSTGQAVVAQAGNTTLTASSGSISGSLALTTTNAVPTSIAVSPASVTLAAGQTQQFAATATMSDGSQQTVTASVHWSVSAPSLATVSNSSGSNGLLTTNAAGNLNVTATLGSISGNASVTVGAAALSSLTIAPNPVSLPAGTTSALTVTGTYSDGSTANVNNSTWSSADTSIATVDPSGLLHGTGTGSTTVTAAVQGVHTSAAVTVTSAVLQSISLAPTNSSVAVGLHTQVTATGTYSDGNTANITNQVQWSSSASSVATVSNTGLVSALQTGSTTLTATLNSVSHSVPLTVTSAVLQSISVQASASSFALGQSLQLTAIGNYSDGTTQNLTSSVTWSSQSSSVGIVSSGGLATGVTIGSFNAVATLNSVSGTLPISVTAALLQSIVVTPANRTTVNVASTSVQYTATGHFSDGTTQNLTTSVHWTIPSGVAVGSISSSGSFSPLGVGTGTVAATSGSITGFTGFTVVSAF